MLQNVQAEFIENLIDDRLNEIAATHFKIHRHNMKNALVNALTNAYPLLCKLLGDEFFIQCAYEYIERYPSRSGNLYEYGEYVADFFMEHEFTHHLHYLSEVAQFEWICHNLYVAADHAPFDTAKLNHLSAGKIDQLHFSLHPASTLKSFRYPITTIIELCKGEIDHDINIEQGGIKLLIIRRDLEIKLAPLTSSEFTFLQCLNEGLTLSEAMDLTMASSDVQAGETPFKLEEKLPQWVRDKTLVDCY